MIIIYYLLEQLKLMIMINIFAKQFISNSQITHAYIVAELLVFTAIDR